MLQANRHHSRNSQLPAEGRKKTYLPPLRELLKPDIILYEEQLPAENWRSARQEIICLRSIINSGIIPNSYTSLRSAFNSPGEWSKVIILNYSHTHLDDQAAVNLQGDLAEILPLITEKVLNEKE